MNNNCTYTSNLKTEAAFKKGFKTGFFAYKKIAQQPALFSDVASRETDPFDVDDPYVAGWLFGFDEADMVEQIYHAAELGCDAAINPVCCPYDINDDRLRAAWVEAWTTMVLSCMTPYSEDQ